MSNQRTTKDILQEAAKNEARIPLYNPKALEAIREEFEKWKATSVREQERKNWAVTPFAIMGDEIPRKLLYTPLEVADLDYVHDLGFSGDEPYTRGIHANMYRGRNFTIRPLPGAGSPEEMNSRYKFLISQGATGLSVALDLPSVQMFDSDEPESRGNVAVVGVPVDCVQDWEVIFKDIPIDKVSVSIVTHYPRNTAILFPMYLVMAEKRGIPWDKLPGSVQNDFIMENVVRGAIEYIPPRDCFRIQCDNIEFIRKEVPLWNYITLNGYNLRENGTSGITSIAVAMANGIAIIDDMKRRGHDADWVGERIAFFWSFGNDFFSEIASLRAARRLWYKIMKHRFGAKNPRSMLLRCHIQTSGISLTREEPLNNIIRAAYHALAAVLGGTQSLHVDTYDEAYSVPSERTLMPSVQTQHIIESETQTTLTVDPLAGSFFVESLTNEIEEKALNELAEIEEMGGIVNAVESGWLHNKIARFTEREQQQIEKGIKKVVGRNVHQSTDAELPTIEVSEYDEGKASRMIEKLRKLRKERDNAKVNKCLKELRDACKRGDNVTYYTLEAARANATEGELRQAFTDAFGTWKPPM
jgi:methylmalonyl-CoA mutase N-terminal domain/subunit